MNLDFSLSDQETVEFLLKNKEFVIKLLNKYIEDDSASPIKMYPPFKEGDYPIDGWRNPIIQLLLEIQENHPNYLRVVNSFIHLLPDDHIERLLEKFAKYEYWKFQLWSPIEDGISNLLAHKNLVAAKFFHKNYTYLLDVGGSVNITLRLNQREYMGEFERLVCGILPYDTVLKLPYPIKIDSYHHDYLKVLNVHFIQSENGVICKIPATSNSDFVRLVGDALMEMAKNELTKTHAAGILIIQARLEKYFQLNDGNSLQFDIIDLVHVLVENQKEGQPLKIEHLADIIADSMDEFGVEAVLNFFKM